ncbi:MAG: radical SAM protein [Anaerolineae bacterium]|nr:radical SAM protein [Anaerolineae bacterium]
MKVLIISSNTLPGASPSGPAYVAGAVREAGHLVDVYESLFAADSTGSLAGKLNNFQPDVVGVSIRLVHGDVLDAQAALGTRHLDLRPRVKKIVDVIRQNSKAKIVLGGPGFSYYAHDWLDYLDVNYGIRGEGELSFPLFLQHLAEGGDIHAVPGCVFRKNGRIKTVPLQRVKDWESMALPAYDLFEPEKDVEHKVAPAIFTKRGCAFACTYCPYSKLEGKRYRLKSPERVLAEIRHILAHTSSRQIMFCDNSFNAPRQHAQALCRAFIDESLDFSWGTGDLKPIGVTPDFCRLIEDSGCFYVNLAIESASATMLQRMKRGYTVRQVRESLDALNRSNIPFGASVMFGAPGETPETIAETLNILNDYLFPCGIWVTLGIYLWTDYQDIVAEARQTGFLQDDKELFSGAVYLSPDLPRSYLEELSVALRAKPGYKVQFNKPSENWTL